jgi:hypothetical protein
MAFVTPGKSQGSQSKGTENGEEKAESEAEMKPRDHHEGSIRLRRR